MKKRNFLNLFILFAPAALISPIEMHELEATSTGPIPTIFHASSIAKYHHPMKTGPVFAGVLHLLQNPGRQKAAAQ